MVRCQRLKVELQQTMTLMPLGRRGPMVAMSTEPWLKQSWQQSRTRPRYEQQEAETLELILQRPTMPDPPSQRATATTATNQVMDGQRKAIDQDALNLRNSSRRAAANSQRDTREHSRNMSKLSRRSMERLELSLMRTCSNGLPRTTQRMTATTTLLCDHAAQYGRKFPPGRAFDPPTTGHSSAGDAPLTNSFAALAEEEMEETNAPKDFEQWAHKVTTPTTKNQKSRSWTIKTDEDLEKLGKLLCSANRRPSAKSLRRIQENDLDSLARLIERKSSTPNSVKKASRKVWAMSPTAWRMELRLISLFRMEMCKCPSSL